MVVRSHALRFILVMLIVAVPVFAGPGVAKMIGGGSQIEWQLPAGGHDVVTLSVSTPSGDVITREIAAGKPVALSVSDLPNLEDGSYTYQITTSQRVPAHVQKLLAAARENGNDAAARAILKGAGIREPQVESGAFMVVNGALVTAGGTESQRPVGSPVSNGSRVGAPVTNDQVIPDDLIVQQSLCVGFDCVNNESFGFDTIRLKENNTRIKFEDTSVGSFPTNDWQLTANDSASGGSSKFSIEDITGSKVPFTITAGASTNSIFVDSTGRVGLRTSTPVLDLHINTSNTPAIRLEQNNSGGFTAQTWDIGANEANFFVRDVTGGSKLSLRIRPGAPTSSVDISADGDVGIGTGSPDNSLHVFRSDGTAKAKVEETNGTAALRTLLELENNGGIQLLMNRTDGSSSDWQISNFSATFVIGIPGSATNQMTLSSAGNMTIGGTQYLTGSSRDLKENFTPVNGRELLAKVVDMPLTSWNAKNDPEQRHIGPVAEDWWSYFELGPDNKHVSPTDIAGVALGAIKGLNQVVSEKDKEIADLKARLEKIEAMLANQQQQ